MKVQSQQWSYFRWLSIRHKTITLHRHQKDFLDKLVVKENSLKETFKQRKLLRTRFGKNIFEKNFYPEKVNYVLACLLFFLDKFGLFKIGMYEDSWGELKPVSFSISSTLPRKNYLKFWKKTCRRKKKNLKIVLGAENLFMVCLVCR